MHLQKRLIPGLRSPIWAVALLGALLVVVALAGCTGPTQGNVPSENTAAPAASATRRPAVATSASAGKAPTGTPPGNFARPQPARTTAASGKAQPVPGLTIPTPVPGERLATVTFERLPREAQDTIRLIAAGGPFPYRQDGITFENRERMLPQRSSGYYKEYTVETPGSPDRGARRIVAGQAGELYYTDDHYATFKRVVP